MDRGRQQARKGTGQREEQRGGQQYRRNKCGGSKAEIEMGKI